MLLAGRCGGKHPTKPQQGWRWARGGQSQAKAVAEPVPGSLSPGGAEAPNPTPKGTGTVRDGHRAEHSPHRSAAPVGSAPGSSNPFWKRLQQLPNPASPSRCLLLSEGNLPQLLCKIVLLSEPQVLLFPRKQPVEGSSNIHHQIPQKTPPKSIPKAPSPSPGESWLEQEHCTCCRA